MKVMDFLRTSITIDDNLDSEERKKHNGVDEGMDVVELYF